MSRGTEVPISPCLDYAEGLHAYFQAKPLSLRRSSSICESVEEDFENDVRNLDIYYYNKGFRLHPSYPPPNSTVM